MPGLEEENPSIASGPGAAGAKHLSPAEPSGKYHVVGFGNVEKFTEHFFLLQLKGGRDAPGNRMGGGGCPDSLKIVISPAERAAGAQEQLQRLAQMGRVQGDEAHAGQHLLLDLLCQLIRDCVMDGMAAPDQHVRILQDLVGQAESRHVQSQQSRLNVVERTENAFQKFSQAAGIDFLDGSGAALQIGGIVFKLILWKIFT